MHILAEQTWCETAVEREQKETKTLCQDSQEQHWDSINS